MRLQKYMASCGLASRRKCEEYISQGRVTLNGETVREMGVQVEEGDAVCFDGKPLHPEKRKQYLLLNKPQGVVTTLSDPQGRRTVRDLIPDIHERVFPVGRLDYETEGLLLLTNDGALMQGLTHPSHEVEKRYRVRARGELSERALGRLESGVTLDDGHRTAPARVQLLPDDPAFPGQKNLLISVHEGHNRLVRRMFEAVGAQVTFLRRESIGSLTLGSLKPGAFRHLTEGEVLYLKKLAGEGAHDAT
ncbi:MAG: pseudouridine synthase [Candidatus Spyradocola sp.]|jgi:23S rRNA pseudouridine2605 synthase